jgi:hypothetical protein
MKTISIPRARQLANVTNNMFLSSATWDSFDTSTFQLVSSASTFIALGVQPGYIVFNPENSSTWAEVVSVDSETQLTLSGVFSTTVIGGTTELQRFSIVTPAEAFLVSTTDLATAKQWWSTSKVGDKIQSKGQQQRTLANLAVSTILDITIDVVAGTAEITVDKPMQTSNPIWAYKQGDIMAIPVNYISGLEFYSYANSTSGEFIVIMYMGGADEYEVRPINEFLTSAEDVLALQPKFEAAVMNAISEVIRAPWPTANVMIEDSYGWEIDFYYEY